MDSKDFLSNLSDNLINRPLDELKNEQFSLEVASGKVRLLTIVQSLEGVLTNENIGVREKGVEFLSWLLSKVPKNLFSPTEVRVLVNFFCGCLKGHHNFISSSIKAFLELIKMEPLTKEDLIKILGTVFQNVTCQSQLHPDRMVLYSILEFVIKNFLNDLKEMGPDFVFGVISLVEGESDPICLNLIFKYFPEFIKNFELGHLVDEVFEVLSCYFPLDFNPSSKDSLVTREELSEGLHQCLSATHLFSELSIPLILDKIDSTLKTAKLDCYKLLQECCKTIRAESLEKYIISIWQTLSKDLLPGNEIQISTEGLNALTDIFFLLSKDQKHENILNTFLDDILITIRSLIRRVDENMFQPAIRVLVAASKRSKPATRRVLCHLKTFSQLGPDSTLMEKKIVLSSLLPFLNICHEFGIMESKNNEEMSSYLDLVNLYLNAGASADGETRKLAFSGILQILPYSSAEFRKKVHEILLVNITTKDDVRLSSDFTNVWRSLAINYQPEFYEFVTGFPVQDTDSHYQNFLWALSLIADLPTFTDYVVSTFVKTVEGGGNHAVALESLLNACRFAKTNGSTNFFHVIHSEHNVINRLIVWWVGFKPKEDGKTLNLVSETIALVTRNQNSDIQGKIVDAVTPIFFGEAAMLNGNGDGVPFRENPDFVLILEAVLGSVRPEINIPMVWELREMLTNLALKSTDDAVRLSASRLLATFANKSEESVASELSGRISKDVFANLEDDSDLKVKLNSSVLFTWVAKGVILRGGPSSEEWISTWFSLLGRKDIGEAVAEGFRTVMEEDELYLNLDSHCNVKVLYRQRLFGHHPKLVRMYEMSDWSVRMNFLLALVRLLQGVPIHLIRLEISTIITLLVRCLDADKPEILLTSLEILTVLLESKEEVLADYSQSFVPKFLRLARFENHMKIRINALKCLFFYGFYPTVYLLPLKIQVIRELESCLDDKKRLARKEAVRARCRWFLVGSPGEDIIVS